MKDFEEFLLRGNLVDTAVGIVIGLAFAAVVAALVENLVTPLIAAIVGEPSFADLSFTINGSTFGYGNFLNALLTFVLVAAVVYFLVVKPVNRLLAARKTEPPVDTTVRQCPDCLSEIPVEATRCAFCTQEVPAVTA
jgi:large conductance mechanosensitive channel